ncbi:hypothetical protein ACFU76_27300 [Streptomyces sp. NPDC057539]|uniref:hypothetical protein n=1 Tax=Streptomyces sp. NPDC057539 TaxID=3346159 RepID=UPI003679ABF2
MVDHLLSSGPSLLVLLYTFRCRMPAAAVSDCLPAFLSAVTQPVLIAADEQMDEAPCPARTRLRKLLFGEHPLARPIPGRAGALDLAKVHQDVMAIGAPLVVVAGPEALVSQALEVLKSRLPASAAEPARTMKREAPPMEVFSVGGVNLRAASVAARARVAAGGVAASRTEPAAAAERVLVELFGPGSASVLQRTLCTDIGIDCGLEAAYEGYQDCGLWQVRLDLDTEWVATAESLVRELVELTAAGRLDETAFLAVRAAARDRAVAKACDVSLASYRVALAALDGGMPSDPVQSLEQVTPEELASAAARVLREGGVPQPTAGGGRRLPVQVDRHRRERPGHPPDPPELHAHPDRWVVRTGG